MDKPSVGDRIELKIDKLTYGGGRGLGRHFNFVVFVPFTAPGDQALVEITKVKKRHAEAKLIEIKEPSPQRITAPCIYFGECGGCQWQHLNYAEQLRQKQGFILRLGEKLMIPTSRIAEIVSDREFRYRNRVQLHAKPPKIGFFAKQSHHLVDVEDCLIAEEELFKSINSDRAGFPQGRTEVAINSDGEVVRRTPGENSKEIFFAQVNRFINEKLVRRVVELSQEALGEQSSAKIWDLYAGAGNFAFPLAHTFSQAHVSAVEWSSLNCQLGQERAPANCEFIESDVDKFVQNQRKAADLIVLDPPRQGVHSDSLNQLLKLRPKNLIYISCDLASLERDLNHLKEGYEVLNLEGFDMFPQTEHVETLVFLRDKELNIC